MSKSDFATYNGGTFNNGNPPRRGNHLGAARAPNPAVQVVQIVCSKVTEMSDRNAQSKSSNRQTEVASHNTSTSKESLRLMPFRNTPALLLPVDLWATVFSILAEEAFKEAVLVNTQEFSCGEGEPAELYSEFHNLRTVCKHFRQVFEEHTELSSCLFLDHRFNNHALGSLLRRLQRHDTFIKSVVAKRGSPWAETVLAGAFTAPQKPLQSLVAVVLCGASSAAVSLLAACSNPESCTITSNCTEVDLSCLQGLPRLSHLRLHTDVSGMDKLAHLTHLELFGADVDCNNISLLASSLKSLTVKMGMIFNLHRVGLSACSALQTLVLNGCVLEAAEAQHTLDVFRSPAELPLSLSALVQLTSLSLKVCATFPGPVEVPWLFELTSLVSLHLFFDRGAVQHTLTNQLSSLRQLQHLSIQLSTVPGSVLSVKIEWHLMPCLLTVDLTAIFDDGAGWKWCMEFEV